MGFQNLRKAIDSFLSEKNTKVYFTDDVTVFKSLHENNICERNPELYVGNYSLNPLNPLLKLSGTAQTGLVSVAESTTTLTSSPEEKMLKMFTDRCTGLLFSRTIIPKETLVDRLLLS